MTTSWRGDDVTHQTSEDALGGPVDIDVGGVDQRPAGLAEVAQLVAGLVLVGVTTPRHRAQAQSRDGQAGRAEVSLLHAG